MNRTPLYDSHVALGARMAPFGGWDMPIEYAGILGEHAQTRTAAAVFDICHMGEFELSGPTAEADLERLLTQNVLTIRQGQCRYGYLLGENGGPLDDLTCYRRGGDRFMLVVNAGTCAGDSEWIRSHLSRTTKFADISPKTGKLDIQGPASRNEMEAALGVKLPELKYFWFTDIELLGVKCILSRTGYTGEWGYELYMPWEKTKMFWDLFLKGGRIKPVGLGARDTLRLEVGYPLYGHELTCDMTPISASRGHFIDTTKDFIGKTAVMRDLEKGTPRLLVGLKLASKRAARAHDAVVQGGRTVGQVTSGSFAPSLGCAVAMAYVDRAVSEPGTALELAVRGGTLPATVVDLPFYKDGTARGLKK